MRYLGVDYGRKRIGLALSDPGGRIAFPHATVARLDEVAAVVHREGVGALVVGLPFSAAHREAGQARSVRAFAAKLGQAVQLPVVFEDELLTTKIAERHAERGTADAAAAALILQSYLDRINEPRH